MNFLKLYSYIQRLFKAIQKLALDYSNFFWITNKHLSNLYVYFINIFLIYLPEAQKISHDPDRRSVIASQLMEYNSNMFWGAFKFLFCRFMAKKDDPIHLLSIKFEAIIHQCEGLRSSFRYSHVSIIPKENNETKEDYKKRVFDICENQFGEVFDIGLSAHSLVFKDNNIQDFSKDNIDELEKCLDILKKLKSSIYLDPKSSLAVYFLKESLCWAKKYLSKKLITSKN